MTEDRKQTDLHLLPQDGREGRGEGALSPEGPRARGIDPETRRIVKAFLSRISSRYDVAGAILYGSRARGTHEPNSDVDVAVLLRGPRGRLFKTAGAMAAEAVDAMLETDIYVLVEPLPVWMEEWEHPETYSNPDLLKQIANEGVWVRAMREIPKPGWPRR